MNAGARAANAGFLLFLHADSRLESPRLLADAFHFLRDTCRAQGHERVAGHFALRFRRERDHHRLGWRYLEAKTGLNRPGTTSGDQGLLLSRRYFDEIGAFDEALPLLEDQRICARIRATGTLVTLPGSLQTSARRFERGGFHRQRRLMMLIMTMHALGLRAFFEQGAGLYRAQHEAGGTRGWPSFRLAMRLLRADGLRGYLAHWRRIGRYGCENAWQMFFFIDVMFGREAPHPLLDIHDRHIVRLLRHPLSEVLAAAVLWLHLHLVMVPWLWLEDRLRA